MIKLFRNFRKQLLNEGKTTKYFKYTIGEIVLVVIGILIALQINNWNEERNNKKRLKQYFTALLKDLELDKSKLEGCLKFDQDKIIQIDTISDPLPDLLQSENDRNDVHDLLNNRSIIIHDATFKSMSSSNGLELISDIDLQNAISQYYSNLTYIQRFEDWYLNNIYSDFLEYVNRNPNPKLSEIRGYLKTARAVSENEYIRYKEAIIQLEKLKSKLKVELNKSYVDD